MSRILVLVFRFFVSEVWPFDCLLIFCVISILVRTIHDILMQFYMNVSRAKMIEKKRNHIY